MDKTTETLRKGRRESRPIYHEKDPKGTSRSEKQKGRQKRRPGESIARGDYFIVIILRARFTALAI